MRPVFLAAIGVIIAGVLLLSAACGRGPDIAATRSQARQLSRSAAGSFDRGAGPGSIRGLVVADDTGLPIRRAEISATAETGGSQRTVSSADGRFALRDLLPGRYRLSCSKAGFVPIDLGQPRPFALGHDIEVAGGTSIEAIEFRLERGAVISGRVLDEFGEPLAGISVELVRWGYAQGQRVLRAVPWAAGVTDDLGRYRLYGLPPGEFFLRASASAAAVEDESGIRIAYLPIYYPGTADVGAAELVTLSPGQQVESKDLAFRPAPAVRITGHVIGSNGSPRTGGDVALLQLAAGRYDRPAWGLDSARIGVDGAFTLPGVTPGQYLVQVQTADISDRRGQPRGGFQEIRGYEFALVPLVVKDAAINDLRVVTAQGGSATGRVVFDEGAQPRFGPNSLSLAAAPVGIPLSRMNSQSARARVHTDWTFEFAGLVGPRVFRVADLPGWTLKAVRRNGTDITDVPLEFSGGGSVAGIEIVMSNRITEMTGGVRDAAGRAVADYAVVVFAEDASRWKSFNVPSQIGPRSQAASLAPFGTASRFVQIGRPNQQGQFRIAGLPAGRYLAVALESIEDGAWYDPALLERLRPHGTEVSLAEGERKPISPPLVRAELK